MTDTPDMATPPQGNAQQAGPAIRVLSQYIKDLSFENPGATVQEQPNIELGIDAMEMADHIDHAVIFSGDGDFRSLVEALQRKGKRVSAVSTIRSQPPMIADELRRQVDNFIEMDDLSDVIGRAPRPRPDSDDSDGDGEG